MGKITNGELQHQCESNSSTPTKLDLETYSNGVSNNRVSNKNHLPHKQNGRLLRFTADFESVDVYIPTQNEDLTCWTIPEDEIKRIVDPCEQRRRIHPTNSVVSGELCSDNEEDEESSCSETVAKTPMITSTPKSSFKGSNRSDSCSSYGGSYSQSSPLSMRRYKRKVHRFYRKQNNLVLNYARDSSIIEESQKKRKRKSPDDSEENDDDIQQTLSECAGEEGLLASYCEPSSKSAVVPIVAVYNRKRSDTLSSSQQHSPLAARWLAFATLCVNISLVVAKGLAAYLSGSLSIISSLVDSAVDISSGLVIWLTARAIKKRDPYLYPRGRTRLEPIALIIVSVIMGVASVQMIVQSFESIMRKTVDPHIDMISIAIMVTTVAVKFTLVLICQRFKSNASIAVLAQDHRNDCISNSVALLCAWGATNYWIYLDPIGAIVVSVYIAITWFLTGKEHLTMLSGKSAEPDFINRIIKVCVEHDKRIDFIDTVYVYHYGMRFLVEVHIVLDENMTLKKAHDISERLQNNIESLEEVERAFVHCDYEYAHMPADEHKIV